MPTTTICHITDITKGAGHGITKVDITSVPTAPDTGDSSPDIGLGLLPDSTSRAPSVTFMDDVTFTRPADTDYAPSVRPPPEPPPRAMSLIAGDRAMAPNTSLVSYQIPLDKARCSSPHQYFPQGSIMDPNSMARPTSPTTPFEFPFDMTNAKSTTCLDDEARTPYTRMGSVRSVHCTARLCPAVVAWP